MADFLPRQVVVIVFLFHIFFWLRLTDIIVLKVRPPSELVLLVLLILFQLEFLIVANAFSGQLQGAGNLSAGGVLTFIQTIMLALVILLMGVVLVQGNKGKKIILLFYGFLGGVIFYFLHKDAVVTTYFFELILLITLISKTGWLEELTKTECWIYWVGAILLFAAILNKSPLPGEIPDQLRLALLWHKGPYYLFLLFKIYLLVLVIKIPVVVVYNHAQLSRKLKIAGLFQSTFPQFMQLAMLLIVFYFFISGWQAENFREAVVAQMRGVAQDSTQPFTTVKINRNSADPVLSVPGYRPIEFPREVSKYQVVGLTPVNADSQSAQAYFLYLAGPDQQDNLALIDSRFLQRLAKDLPVLAGSQLAAYPFTPKNRMESFVYNANARSLGRLSAYFPFTLLPYYSDNLQIFPFTILPHQSESRIQIELNEDEAQKSNFLLDLGSQGLQERKLAVGRLFLPLILAQGREHAFFAFDIVLTPHLAFGSSPLLRLLIFLSLIYMAVNMLVTRRMINFGEQINRLVVNRFNQLKRGIREISTGNLDYKIKLEGEDEFVELADRFNHMGERLQETVAESVEKERLEHELGIARQVQLSLLPRELPEIPGYQIAGSMETATEVGGDFYDVLPLSNNKFLITIGDVSGKGSSAALYMAQCVSLIRFAHQFSEDPAEITIRLNNYFSDPMVDSQTFVTAILGVLDAKRNQFHFVRAGHTYPVLIPGNERNKVQELRSRGLGIGIAKGGTLFEEKLEERRHAFRLKDALLLYSDGLVEAAKPVQIGHGHEGELQHYGDARLIALLDHNRHESASVILAAIESDIKSFYQMQSAVDDHTLMVIRRATTG